MNIDQLWGYGMGLTVLQNEYQRAGNFLDMLSFITNWRKKSAFDYVIIIVLGSILARVVVGASPFLPAASAALVMALMNRLLAKLCAKFPKMNNWLNGEAVILYADNKVIWENLRKASLSFAELKESLRLELKTGNLNQVEMASWKIMVE